MAERYTRKDAEKAFELLCAATGKRIATSYNDVGAWTLDYNEAYGGFTVGEVANEQGGESRPLGDRRRSAREFCQSVNFARLAIEAREGQ